MRPFGLILAVVAFSIGVFMLVKSLRTPEPAQQVVTSDDAGGTPPIQEPDSVDAPPRPEPNAKPNVKIDGRWRVARVPAEEYTEEDKKKLEELQALPYLQGYKEAPGQSEVTIHDPDAAQAGYNLYNSGHYPEATLMDMDGNALHTWRFDYREAFPRIAPSINNSYWRRVHLLPNGDILGIFDDIGIVRLDAHSDIVWKKRIRSHHDLDVTADGKLYLITHNPEVLRRGEKVRQSLPDNVVIVNLETGALDADHSLLQAFENSEYIYILDLVDNIAPNIADIFHTNSIRVFDGSLEKHSPYFKKGNVVVSLLRLDTIAIVDLSQGKVVWASTGDEHKLWYRQHDPTFQPDGTMLLFDNRGNNGRSKVIQLDPFSNKVVWQYADGAGVDFFSKTCGTAERMVNGNTLITESDNGRAFEVNMDGDIVWEFWNPHRAGEDNELIATLFEVQRIDPAYAAWLETYEPKKEPKQKRVRR